MFIVHQRLGVDLKATEDTAKSVDAIVILNHEQRARGRMLITCTQGVEVRLFLKRGQPLLVNEYLKSDCGSLIKIEGAQEDVTVAHCEDWLTFSRACYHLGNRHVKVQIEGLSLMIKPDHVLEEMLVHQGLSIHYQQAVFVPESGAYQQGHHAH